MPDEALAAIRSTDNAISQHSPPLAVNVNLQTYLLGRTPWPSTCSLSMH